MARPASSSHSTAATAKRSLPASLALACKMRGAASFVKSWNDLMNAVAAEGSKMPEVS